jgi:hypothetical protein
MQAIGGNLDPFTRHITDTYIPTPRFTTYLLAAPERSATEGDVIAIRREISVINLKIMWAGNKGTNITNPGHWGGQGIRQTHIFAFGGPKVDIADTQLPISFSPGHFFAVTTDVRPAPFDSTPFQIKESGSVGLKSYDGVAVTHTTLYGSEKPVAVGRPANSINVMQVFIWVAFVGGGFDIINKKL